MLGNSRRGVPPPASRRANAPITSLLEPNTTLPSESYMLGSMMPSNGRVIAFAAALVAIGVGVGVAVDRAAFAQQPSNGIKRTILQRADEPGAVSYTHLTLPTSDLV